MEYAGKMCIRDRSKCHHVIDRFSEDIDITFSDTLTQGQRKKLKNNVIANISKTLELPIPNWEETRSRRDYNSVSYTHLSRKYGGDN